MALWAVVVALALGGLLGEPDLPAVSQRRLDAAVKTWQRALNLDAWDAEAYFVGASELKPHTLGHSKWDDQRKTVTILVLRPSSYQVATQPKQAIVDAIETTVLHELIHLKLHEFTRPTVGAIWDTHVEESLVCELTEAMLKLARQFIPRSNSTLYPETTP